MSMDRRQFLKLAGFSTVLGIGAATAVNSMGHDDDVEASEFQAGPDALKAKRWGFVIDMSKFKTEDDFKRVIHACHSIHNVPDYGNPKDEIKWIWKDTFEHAFLGQEDHI